VRAHRESVSACLAEHDQVADLRMRIWNADGSEVEVPLGRAGAKKLQYMRLGKGTSQHVLIAGKTGSGKSTLLHVLITNIALRIGNGVEIFRDKAPFDAILSAAAPSQMPEELIEQLGEGGRMVIPVGGADWQYLWLVEREGGSVRRTQLDPVRFVPLR